MIFAVIFFAYSLPRNVNSLLVWFEIHSFAISFYYVRSALHGTLSVARAITRVRAYWGLDFQIKIIQCLSFIWAFPRFVFHDKSMGWKQSLRQQTLAINISYLVVRLLMIWWFWVVEGPFSLCHNSRVKRLVDSKALIGKLILHLMLISLSNKIYVHNKSLR